MIDVRRLQAAVLALTGRDVAPYKPSVVRRRVRVRCREAGIPGPDAYLELLEAGGDPARDEADRLVRALSVPVSSFFRDPEVFRALEHAVWPALLDRAWAGAPVRMWCAACSRGQEAYSLAASFLAAAERAGARPALRVLGTDVDAGAIEAARAGGYPRESLACAPERLRRRYFEDRGDGSAVVGPELRERVRFAVGDVFDGVARTRDLDLVACRNLLIYFRRPVQEALILGLLDALRPGGYLVLGVSESVLGRPWERVEHVDPERRIYRKPARGARSGSRTD